VSGLPSGEHLPRWGPPPWRWLAYAAAAVVVAVAVPLVDGGYVLVPVAGLLLVLSALDRAHRVALALDTAGLQLSRGFGRMEQLPWGSFIAKLSTDDRYGVPRRYLELDISDERLVLLSRRRLGADPETVLAAINSAAAARG
jgi:hypothetical protein